MQYHLTMVAGSSKGACWPVEESGLVLGRALECGIVVSDSAVSRRHCHVIVRDGQLLLEDLGSRSPALVNGEPTERCVLGVGDEIGLGRHRFLVTGTPARPESTGLRDSPTPSNLPDDGVYLIPTDREALWKRQKPRTWRDLASLYDAACELGCAENLADLLDSARRRLEERFATADVWMARTDRTGAHDFVVRPRDCDSGETPLEAIRQALQTRSGIATPERRSKDGSPGRLLTLAAPLVFSEVPVGGIAVRMQPPSGLFDEADLHYVVLLAQSLAPLVEAMETVEQLRRDNERLRSRTGESFELVGQSRAMEHVRGELAVAAKSDLHVLITGETGTGKELAARTLHARSDRRSRPLVVMNCAAIPRDLFESELFGHVKGAFTGAQSDAAGLVAQADGGTLFLDEVGDLSLDNQARILRVVEQGTYRPVGGVGELCVNMRVVAATNKDLQHAITRGTFRQDLYHRLSVYEIHLPALRERPSDIPLLADHFLRLAAAQAGRHVRGFTDDALQCLRARTWPGNVRELRNAVVRAVNIASGDLLTTKDFVVTDTDEGPTSEEAPALSLADMEKRHIEAVLHRCHGNVVEAARILEVSRSTLYRKLAEYGIKP